MRLGSVCLLLLFITFSRAVVWEDCGIPLTRKIYIEGVVLSPTTISIPSQTSDNTINANVNVIIQDYILDTGVNVTLVVEKDGETYFNGVIGDLCGILSSANQISCPLPADLYSLSYQYNLPPLPSGNYEVRFTFSEVQTGIEVGCMSVTQSLSGLGGDACSYSSTLSATFAGTVMYFDDNTVIQIGPYGADGIDLGSTYLWGTFKTIAASPDLVGYTFNPSNYVWGLRGSINTSVSQDQFDGTFVIGYLPDPTNYEGAQLIYQGTFTWIMTPSTTIPYQFQSGQFNLVPGYVYPTGWPYPLNFGNLAPFTVAKSDGQTYFIISSSFMWCRCNCELGGIGTVGPPGGGSSGMSGWLKGTIAVCVIGAAILVAVVFLIVKFRRAKPRPVVYDDADLMDPQKPDYGTMAINDAFEAEEQEYN